MVGCDQRGLMFGIRVSGAGFQVGKVRAGDPSRLTLCSISVLRSSGCRDAKGAGA